MGNHARPFSDTTYLQLHPQSPGEWNERCAELEDDAYEV